MLNTNTTSSINAAMPTGPDFSAVRTSDQFAAMVITRADLSRKASRIAVDRLVNVAAKEFAGYELLEAETVVQVLMDLGTPLPEMSADNKAALERIVGSPTGRSFDTAYMTAEYENHAFLRDLAEAYLKQSDARAPSEVTGRAIGKIAFFAFTEHTGVSHRILKEVAV